MSPPDIRFILPLVGRDLRYEWILSLCMIFSFAAVFSPLFILLGIKNGITGDMLAKFQHDPLSCLVTPKFAFDQNLDDAFVKTLHDKAGVVIFSPDSHFLLDLQELPNGVNIWPTVAVDPLMVENHIIMDGNKPQSVLSASLAKRLKKNVGDTLVLPLERRLSGLKEQAPIETRVAGIMPDEVVPDLKIWLPDWLFAGIRYWQMGRAFPQAGLAGGDVGIEPRYDGVLTISTKTPSREKYQEMLAGPLGFSQLPREIHETGQRLATGQIAMLWEPVNSLVHDDDLRTLGSRHSEMGYVVTTLPWLDKAMVGLDCKKETRDFQITIFSEQTQPVPTPSETAQSQQSQQETGPPVVWLAPEDGKSLLGSGRLLFQGLKQQIAIPVEIQTSDVIVPGFVGLNKNLAGCLNVARRQNLEYDAASGAFYFADQRWRFFRAYAKNIEQLEPLIDFLVETGRKYGLTALTEPNSKIGEVKRFQRLSSYMEQLYALIVAITGVSAFFAIAANVYAGIQRKKYDLAYLRLMGMGRCAVVFFPYLKSLVLVSCGMFLAWAFYLLFNHIASQLLFAGQGRLARMSAFDVAVVACGVWAVASVASLAASLLVYRIDPAESLRE